MDVVMILPPPSSLEPATPAKKLGLRQQVLLVKTSSHLPLFKSNFSNPLMNPN